jgi:hypothetical protein
MAKVKIPKKIAGVKIPKKARKKARKALDMADNPFMRGLATAALASAAQAGVRRRAKAGRVDIGGDALAEAVREAARSGLRAFMEGLEEGLRADKPGRGGGDADDRATTH